MPHSRFLVHNTVTVPPGDGKVLERLARYVLRAPVSLKRCSWDADAGVVAAILFHEEVYPQKVPREADVMLAVTSIGRDDGELGRELEGADHQRRLKRVVHLK
jgi:hypothetical protein